MYTQQDLQNALEGAGVNPNDTLMVHVSFKSIGPVVGGGESVLRALMTYMAGGLLVLPAHTWSNVGEQNPVMDVLLTPACVGYLPELFRRQPGVYRSLHPTHSLAAYGRDAQDFVAGNELAQTPCGKETSYYKLYERQAQILLIGVGCTRNTYIHGLEEWDGAQGTLSDQATTLYVIDEAGKRHITPQYRHCAPLGSETFDKLEPLAARKGILREGRFGDAKTMLMDAAGLRDIVAKVLSIDNTILLRPEPLDARFDAL